MPTATIRFVFLLIAAGILVGTMPLCRGVQGDESSVVDFAREIRPILAKHCYSCHGVETKESGLALHEFDQATSKLDSGLHAIVPGIPDESEILKRVASSDPSMRMPPEGDGLSERQIEMLREWIRSGAEYKAHWAFLPLSAPKVPNTSDHPIDAFIDVPLRKKGMQRSPIAAPRELIRRVYFDCVGVPPESDVVEDFAKEPSYQAYEAIIDRLLADPRFGERMARDWLDVVRYAETNSFERDGPKPNAWKYRDYVIDSFNQDKPYDQFLIEQLAGDEISNPTPESLTATGFYRLGIWDDEPADPALARMDEFDDLVTTIGQGIMGLTMNCARCHDHKIDPIPQRDYYQLVAFLRDVTSYGSRADEKSNSQIVLSDLELSKTGDRLQRELRDLEKEIKSIENKAIAKMSQEDQVAAKSPDRDKVINAKLKDHISEETWAIYQKRKADKETKRKELEGLPFDSRLGLAKCDPNPPATHILLRGSPEAKGDEVLPGFPKLFDAPAPNIPPLTGERKTAGRRIVLAKWLTSSDNRLVSRVIVNRIWQHHFGRGIVRSANNFGQMGDVPTHPELLDFLAQQLIGNEWRLKSLHRLILLSETYRQSSQGSQHSIAEDPENNLFSRFNSRRLSAEELRDTVLAVTGQIVYAMHGPSVFPDVSNDVKAGQSVPGKGWSKSSERDQSRRSVYIHIKRSLVPPELSVFDFPETDVTCEARFLTTQAAQALNLLNGSFLQKHATRLSEFATHSAGKTLETKLRFVMERLHSRPAREDELQRATKRIQSLQDKFSMSQQQAFREYCLVLLNSNEFVYLD